MLAVGPKPNEPISNLVTPDQHAKQSPKARRLELGRRGRQLCDELEPHSPHANEFAAAVSAEGPWDAGGLILFAVMI